MKVLLNGTSVVIGGGLQAATAFITATLADPRCNAWHYVLSAELARQLRSLGIGTESDAFTVIAPAPSRSHASRRRLRDAALQFAPDAVFTFFGPAYVRFPMRHLCGVADGWVTHSTALAFSTLGSPVARLRMLLVCLYKAYWFRRADRWFVEAASARSGLSRRLGVPAEKVAIIANTCAAHYRAQASTRIVEWPPRHRLRILLFAAYYPHKNLEIAPLVAARLVNARPQLDFELVLTIAQDSVPWREIHQLASTLGVADRVVTMGPVDIRDGPALYASCDVLLHPSLLETFSATYPEAMAMGVPIVATDLDFAHDVCGDAALYYAPRDANEAAHRILCLVDDSALRARLVEAGTHRLATLPTASEKYERLLAWIQHAIE